MKISSLSEHVIPVSHKHGNEELELQVNIDAFTPEFFIQQKKHAEEKLKEYRRQIQTLKAQNGSKPKGQKKKAKETEIQKAEREFNEKAHAALMELEYRVQEKEADRQSYARLLSSNVLKGWDLTDDDGNPLAVNYDVLISLPPNCLQDIWDTCVKASRRVKKKVDAEDEETSADTAHGSRVVNLADRLT